MELRYIGTAAAEAFPALFCHCDACERARKAGGKNIRGRSGAVVNGSLLVDFPPDIYFQSLRLGIDLGGFTRLAVTHTHLDHFAANELMMRDPGCYAHLPPEQGRFWLCGSRRVLEKLQAAMKEEFGAVRDFAVFEEAVPFVPLAAGDIRIIPLPARHAQNETCLLYIFEQGGKRMLYGNDTGYFPEETWRFIAGMRFDLVSLDCCFGPQKEGTNHMGLPDDVEVRARMEHLGCADTQTKFVLTHFSHNGGLLHGELEAAAGPCGFAVAYDGMRCVF